MGTGLGFGDRLGGRGGRLLDLATTPGLAPGWLRLRILWLCDRLSDVNPEACMCTNLPPSKLGVGEAGKTPGTLPGCRSTWSP